MIAVGLLHQLDTIEPDLHGPDHEVSLAASHTPFQMVGATTCVVELKLLRHCSMADFSALCPSWSLRHQCLSCNTLHWDVKV